MTEIVDFGQIVLLVAAGFSLALVSSKLTERFPVPGPALFLWLPRSRPISSRRSPITPRSARSSASGSSALIVILFDGGMHVGWRRFRAAAAADRLAGRARHVRAPPRVMAAAAHWLFGFSWTAPACSAPRSPRPIRP